MILGLRIFLTLLIATVPLLGDTNQAGPEQIPRLRPPRGELPPTFWERYWVWVSVVGVLLIIGAGVFVWWLCRPAAAVVAPPETEARRALEPLREQGEKGMVLSRVSQILRQYIIAAFGLAPGERTTAEFCGALGSDERVGPELAAAVSEFLRRCDKRKFAPSSPAQPLGAVPAALELIQQAEARRAEIEQAAQTRELKIEN